MSLAAPWMLLGLLFVAIPIWLHLKRHSVSAIRFAALPLLERVARRRTPKLRLRRIALLILRIALLVTVVLAAARPSISVRVPGGIRKGAPLAMVIVLDNSLSMKLKDENGRSLFDMAKALALTELDRLRPGDAASVVMTCPLAGAQPPKADFDLVIARTDVERAYSTYRRGHLGNALRAALAILEESPLTEREALLISDLNEGGDTAEIPPWSKGTGITFRVLDAGPAIPRRNLAVVGIRTGPSPEGVIREVLIEARVANFSPTDAQGIDVILTVEGAEVARGTVDVRANQSVVKKFHHRFKSDGIYRGAVRIRDDQMPEDNVRHFTASVSHSIAALVIDGDFRPGSYYDEAFYLNRALETPPPGEVPIAPVVTDVENAETGPLSGNGVIFLVGLRAVPLKLADRLVKYVKEGGGLFVTPGENGSDLTPLAGILPARIRSIRQAPRQGRPFTIGAINRSHPLFLPFGNDKTGLESTKIFSHLLLEPNPEAAQETLLDTGDGLPLLLERRIENGRTMLLATTIDRAWSDLPIRPGFLPLVQRAARHLAGRLDDRSPRRVEVGHPVALEVSAGMQRLTVRGPNGQDTVYTAQELDGKTHVMFAKSHLPGDYAVWAEIPSAGGLRELPSLGFTVETNPLESDTRRKIRASTEDPARRFAPVEGNLPIWPYLLFSAFLLLLTEAFVSGLGLRRSHIQRQS